MEHSASLAHPSDLPQGDMVARTIWMDDWEMQCCGEPFEVGSRVTWTLVSANREFKDRSATLLGETEGSRVTD